MKTKPELSVIICTYNRAEQLLRALKTLEQQSFPPEKFEVVVADDGSTDETGELIAGFSPAFTLKYLPLEKSGRSGARNSGLKVAVGKIALFIDDDVFLPPDFLLTHYRIHQRGEKLVGRGPIIDIGKPELPLKLKVSLKDYSTAFLCSCNASLSREAFLNLGGFDPDFIEYGWEDNEAGMRLRGAGFKMYFEKKAFLYHYRPLWQRANLSQMIKKAEEMGRTAVLFNRKHPTLRVKLATGDYFLIKAWGALTANSWISGYLTRLWEKGVSPRLESFIARRIFLHHYLKAMREALKPTTNRQ